MAKKEQIVNEVEEVVEGEASPEVEQEARPKAYLSHNDYDPA